MKKLLGVLILIIMAGCGNVEDIVTGCENNEIITQLNLQLESDLYDAQNITCWSSYICSAQKSAKIETIESIKTKIEELCQQNINNEQE